MHLCFAIRPTRTDHVSYHSTIKADLVIIVLNASENDPHDIRLRNPNMKLIH